jgi:hypothetical protein
MAVLIPNDFSSYNLTEDETLQGSILTIQQQQVIQNQLAVVALEKINLLYDPESPKSFIQREASLQGQLNILRFLLECSDAAILQLNNPEPPY